jgi:hypothetical protein
MAAAVIGTVSSVPSALAVAAPAVTPVPVMDTALTLSRPTPVTSTLPAAPFRNPSGVLGLMPVAAVPTTTPTLAP